MNTFESTVVSPNVRVFHVAGAELGTETLRMLVAGDYVLAEVNGVRPFSDTPIASEQPWEVIESTDTYLSIKHPADKDVLKLEYADMRKGEPAVFSLDRDDPACNKFIVILQFISHKSTITGLHQQRYRWWISEKDYREIFADPIIARGVFERWCEFFGTFDQKGWHHKSMNRFALRARITKPVLNAFRNKDWETINRISEDQLLRIARELESLPTLLRLARQEPESLEEATGEMGIG